jgi:hypothetical protein
MIADFRTVINEGPLECEAAVLRTFCFCVYYVVLISFMNHEYSQNLIVSGALPIYFPGTL